MEERIKKILGSLVILAIGGGMVYWLVSKPNNVPSVKSDTQRPTTLTEPTKSPETKHPNKDSLKVNDLAKQILHCLTAWQAKSTENNLQEQAISQTIQTWQDQGQTDQTKKQNLQKLLDDYSDYEENSLILRETLNYQTLKKAFAEWKSLINQQNEQQEKAKWFEPRRWLTDKEIDWALEQIINRLDYQKAVNYKVLEATQFMFCAHAPENDLEATFSFPVLLSELTGFDGELVFMPVNNPDFHWSLLVYEVSSKKFYHYDTFHGANYELIKSTVEELLKQLWQTNEPGLSTCLVKRHAIKQGNGHDCGVAVIEISKRIMEKYQGDLSNLALGSFDFPQARKDWRKSWRRN